MFIIKTNNTEDVDKMRGKKKKKLVVLVGISYRLKGVNQITKKEYTQLNKEIKKVYNVFINLDLLINRLSS